MEEGYYWAKFKHDDGRMSVWGPVKVTLAKYIGTIYFPSGIEVIGDINSYAVSDFEFGDRIEQPE